MEKFRLYWREHPLVMPLLIVCCGFIIRALAAATESPSLDEGYSYYLAQNAWKDIIAGSNTEPQIPLTYLWLSLFEHFSLNIFWLRLSSLLPGTLAIWLAFLLGRRLHSEKLGLILALSQAGLWSIVQSDLQMRVYGLLVLGISIIIVNVLDILADGSPRWGWPLLAAAIIITALLHYIGSAVCAAVLLCALLWPALPGKKRLIVITALSLIAPILWLGYVNSNVAAFTHNRLASYNNTSAFFYLPADYLGLNAIDSYLAQFDSTSAALGKSLLNLLIPITNLVCWLGYLGGFLYFRRSQPHQARLLLMVSALPLLCLTVGAAWGIQPLQSRYLVPIALPAAALIWFSLLTGEAHHKTHKVSEFVLAGAAFVLALNLGLSMAYPALPYFWNLDWRPVCTFIRERQKPSDVVLVYNGLAAFAFSLAYAPGQITYDISGPTPRFTMAPGSSCLAFVPLSPEIVGEPLKQYLKGKRVFIILNQVKLKGAEAQPVLQFLGQNFTQIDQFSQSGHAYWSNIDVFMGLPKF